MPASVWLKTETVVLCNSLQLLYYTLPRINTKQSTTETKKKKKKNVLLLLFVLELTFNKFDRLWN